MLIQKFQNKWKDNLNQNFGKLKKNQIVVLETHVQTNVVLLILKLKMFLIKKKVLIVLKFKKDVLVHVYAFLDQNSK